MSDYDWSLQQAVHTAISDASISDVVDVVDHKKNDPKDRDFAYVQIGDSDAIPDDVSCANGKEVFFDLHTWARGRRGKKKVTLIMSALHSALHNQTLTVAGLASCHAFVTFERKFDDPDGITLHGVTTLKLLCRED